MKHDIRTRIRRLVALAAVAAVAATAATTAGPALAQSDSSLGDTVIMSVDAVDQARGTIVLDGKEFRLPPQRLDRTRDESVLGAPERPETGSFVMVTLTDDGQSIAGIRPVRALPMPEDPQ